jgi:hypothetical protein
MKSKLSIAPLAHPLIGLILLTVLTPTSSLAQPKTDADYFTYYGTNRRSQIISPIMAPTVDRRLVHPDRNQKRVGSVSLKH